MKTTYYQILSQLPKIPWELLTQSLKQLDHNEFVHSIQYDLRKEWQGLISYQRQGSTGLAKKLTKATVSSELTSWIHNNIIQESQSIAFCKSLNDSPDSNNVIAHTDRKRPFTLIYLLESGGENHATVFYRLKDTTITIEPNMNFSDYDQLEEVDRVSIPLHTWTLLNAQQPHSIENIPNTRLSIQIGLSGNPWQ